MCLNHFYWNFNGNFSSLDLVDFCFDIMHPDRPRTFGPSLSMDWVLAQKSRLWTLLFMAWTCIMSRPLYIDEYAQGLKLWALPRPLIWTRVPSSCFTLMDEYALGSSRVLAQFTGSTSSFDLDEGALILLYS